MPVQRGDTVSRDDLVAFVLEAVYPVGAIYISATNVSPSLLFGGEWQQIKDKFILSAGDTYTNGTSGGAATHTLTTDEMPSHSHTFTGTAVNSGTESAGHTHNYTDYYATTTGGTAITLAQMRNHSHNVYVGVNVQPGGNYWSPSVTTDSNYAPAHTVAQGSNNAHNHSGENTSTTRTSQDVSASHTHSITAAGTNSSTGSGAAFSTLPPYLVAYVWQRIA